MPANLSTTSPTYQEDLVQEAIRRERLVFLGVVTTCISLIPTLYAALISNSITLIADLLRCATEFLAILASWLILRKVAQSDTRYFNYGFGKLEQLSCIAVGGALFVTFLLCLISGIRRVITPEPVVNAEFGLGLAVLSVCGNAFLWMMNYLSFEKLPSPVSDSQWRLFRAKTLATLVVAGSLATVVLLDPVGWILYVDGIGSIILSFFMLWSAYAMVSSSVPDLIDCALEESLQVPILDVLNRHQKDYIEVRQIRSRRTGKRIFVELFISFAPLQTFAKVNDVAKQISSEVEDSVSGAEVIVIPSVVEESKDV